MGQNNEVENPSLILENLQYMKIEDENESSLEKTYHIIRNILSEYNKYKNILSENQKFIENKEKQKPDNKVKKIINDSEHKIKRIKKWVKMSKYSIKEKQNSNNIKQNNTNNKFELSKYADIKIETGLFLYFKNKSSKFIQRVKKGPPDCFRWCSWCILNFLPQERNSLIYENYTNMNLEKENKDRIIRDIERTFSQIQKEKNELRQMEKSLYKILKAFWNLDRDIGYCQGMNLVVGFMLILSNFNERETFFVLSGMFSNTFKLRKKYEYNIRGLFYDEFPLLNLLNYIFEILLDQNCPNLKNHLEELGITIDLWMGRWFHTLFTIALPINWCKRVWDNIFADNIFFLVKFGICLSQTMQEDILKMDEEEQILNYFKKYEKFSLCLDNEELNKKCDLNKLIIKSQKININLEFFLKNYEKQNFSFLQKLNNINDIRYEFDSTLVRKPTCSTILFNDEVNDMKKIELDKSPKYNTINLIKDENEINFSLINVEVNNQNIKNKNSIKLKGANPSKNFTSKNKGNSTDSFHINEINIVNNNININNNKNKDDIIKNSNNEINLNDIKEEKKINEEKNSNIINNEDINNDIINKGEINIKINKEENINLNKAENIEINNEEENINQNDEENLKSDETSDSNNNDYEENIEFDQRYTDIIKKNINMHKFENFLNRNRLDIFSYQKEFKTFEKNDNTNNVLFSYGKNETVGLHRPNEADISYFIGKNKFKNSKIFYSEKKSNN